MQRILTLLATTLLLLSLGLGTVAHGMETMGCEDGASTAWMAGHDDADAGPDRDDSGKATPHQHGGCHGHHAFMLSGAPVDATPSAIDDPRTPRNIAGPMRGGPGSDLRPPIS